MSARGADHEAALRPMLGPDIPAVAALEATLFADDPWSVEAWWRELAQRPRREYVVAEADGQIIGYAGLDHGGDVADVMTVAVGAQGQGRGLGGRLLDHLVQRATDEGAEAVMLEVRDDNLPARNLYERRGFEVINTRRKYYQPGDVDALIMRLVLGTRATAYSGRS